MITTDRKRAIQLGRKHKQYVFYWVLTGRYLITSRPNPYLDNEEFEAIYTPEYIHSEED